MAWESYTASGALKQGTVTTLGWEIVDRKVLDGSTNGHNFLLNNTLYEQFQIRFIGIRPDNNGANIRCKISTDGGSTFVASGYDFAGIETHDGSGVISVITGTGAVDIALNTDGVGNTTTDVMSGQITLLNPNQSTGTKVRANVQSGYGRSADTNTMYFDVNYRADANGSPVNAIRFETNGTTATGTLILMGLPKVITTPVVHKPNGWEVIEQRSHSGSQFMEFNDFAGFGDLQIICRDIQCTTTNVGLQFQVSTDGGSSFLTTASYVQGGIYQRFGQAVNNYTAAVNTAFSLGGEFSQSGYLANSNRGGFYDIRLSQLADRTSYTVFGKYPDNNGGEMTMINQCGHLSGSIGVVNAFRIGPNLGTMSGKFTLLGLADF